MVQLSRILCWLCFVLSHPCKLSITSFCNRPCMILNFHHHWSYTLRQGTYGLHINGNHVRSRCDLPCNIGMYNTSHKSHWATRSENNLTINVETQIYQLCEMQFDTKLLLKINDRSLHELLKSKCWEMFSSYSFTEKQPKSCLRGTLLKSYDILMHICHRWPQIDREFQRLLSQNKTSFSSRGSTSFLWTTWNEHPPP